jgi:guanylate kinase
VPDQPVQDRRRPQRAAAGRARVTLQPLSATTHPVFVVTGPSGAGKGTLIRALTERLPELEVAVSATTRPQRPGEEDGREYWFLGEEEFRARIEAGAFLEHVQYVSARYGTLRSEMDRIGGQGRVCVLELELEGALQVQAEVPGSVTLFIAADVPELERRLRERATESMGEIGDRIELARYQLEQAYRFRYMVRNDDVDRATEVLTAIVERELALAGAGTMSGR